MLIETITPRADAPDETYAQTTMRVRKRNGSSEPVDVNKIVRAVSRCCVGPARRRRACASPPRRSAASTTAPPRASWTSSRSRPPPALIVEEPQYARWPRACSPTYIDKEVRGQEIHAFSQSIAAGAALGLVNDRLRASSTANARKLNDAIDRRARPTSSSTSACARVYDRYLLQAPADAPVIETPQQFFLRVACALAETRAGGARALPAVLVARVPAELADAVQRRHAPRAALELLPARLARRSAWSRSTSATRTSRCSRSSPAASASPTTACARAAR